MESLNFNFKETKEDAESLSAIRELKQTIWGKEVKEDVFQRWSQGFAFDESEEPTALLQYSGGPCPVITAVQAFLLKELLFCSKCGNNWRNPSEAELNSHFADALLSIFINIPTDKDKYLVFHIKEDKESKTHNENEQCLSINNNELSEFSVTKRIKLDNFEEFIQNLRIYKFKTLNELKVKLYEQINEYKLHYGILCFLYSLILTKDLNHLKKELEENGDFPLIDPLHGHGSQSLLNLMLCGIGTNYCFDGIKNLEGLSLQGISKQSTIGYLTLLEYLRYCEVGWYLKNPVYPIWILASETHFTVFFSQEKSLIQKNDVLRQFAIKKFQVYDQNENGFVKIEDLENLMQSLELLTDKEYIEAIKQQLDSENLGIVTKSAFLNEFYPESDQKQIPENFVVYHYNGLGSSLNNYKVKYATGLAKIVDFTEDQEFNKTSSLRNCLQTKWPTIEIEWENNKTPSIN